MKPGDAVTWKYGGGEVFRYTNRCDFGRVRLQGADGGVVYARAEHVAPLACCAHCGSHFSAFGSEVQAPKAPDPNSRKELT